MTVEIKNQQKKKNVNLSKLRKLLEKALVLLKNSSDVSVFLCDNKFIKSLNKKYFKKNIPTDVIAFPLKDKMNPGYLGEIVVSVEQAVKVSKELKLCPEEELVRYLIHGVLHLTGYSDKTKKQRLAMEKKQEEILEHVTRNT